MVVLLCDIVSLVYFIYIPKIIENIANIHCTGNISIRLLVIFIRTRNMFMLIKCAHKSSEVFYKSAFKY